MSTLTERYVQEVARRIPAGQRDDIADELRATIADTVEARGSEREVLTEMGDPIRLAARFAGRPLALIGPELYPAYQRLLVLLLSTVLPIITAVAVVADVFEHNSVGSAIGAGIGVVITVGAQMFAWLTAVFALMDRARGREAVAEAADTWTPDDLPEAHQRNRPDVGACASITWNALLIALIVWQHFAKPYGDRMEVLDPALWSGWIWPVLAGLAALVAIELLSLRAWTAPLVAAYALASAVTSLPLAWIIYRQEFFNPAFLADFNQDWTIPDSLYTLTALSILAVTAYEIFKRYRETLTKA